MKPSMKLEFFSFSIFLFFFRQSCAQLDIKDYVSLISKIIDENQESSVIILYSSKYQKIGEVNVIFEMSKMLSKRKITSVSVAFKHWDAMKRYYFTTKKAKTRIKRPLFVVFLPTYKSLQKFQQVSEDLSLEDELLYLVVFTRTVEEPFTDFCMKSTDKPFKLRIDAMMVVKCSENNTLRAWYTFDNNEMKIATWAFWHPKTEYLQMIHEERKEKINLCGKQLIIGIVNASQLTVWDEKTGKLNGYFGELLDALTESMNFTWKIEKKEQDYGSWNNTGKFWTGAMGALKAREIDLLVTDLTINTLRMKAVDFSKILLSSRKLLFIRKPEYGTIVKWSGYFKFIDNRVWSSMALIMLITPLLLTLMKTKIRNPCISPELISQNYLNIWGQYCQQGLFEFPTALPLRIAYFSIFVSALLILNYYSAFVISNLTYPVQHEFLTNLTAFVRDRSYKLIVLKNGADYNFFEYAKEYPLNAMFRLMMESSDLPTNIQAAFDMVCDQKVGFYINDITSKIRSFRLKCNVYQIVTHQYDNIAMAFPKNSQYKTEINRNFVRFNAIGMFNQLKRKYFKWRSFPETQTFKKVTISEIAVLLFIVGSGIILGIIILLIEKIWSQCKADVKTINVRDFITPGNSKKIYNFENQKRNLDRYNKDGELNIKFLRKDYKHRIILSPGDGRLAFKN